MAVARRNFAGLEGINGYVPGMAYSAQLVHGQPTPVSLGSPAAVDADEVINDVDADAVATTVATASWTASEPYGRTLRVTPGGDPGNSFAFDVRGFDYLGQPMVERFTGANGSTAILYGKKAFKRVTSTKIVTAATNAIVADVGTGFRVGLPYKGDVMWAKENGAFVHLYKRNIVAKSELAAASVAGGPSGAWWYADFPGYIAGIRGTPRMPVGSTNDPVVTVELGGVAVVGLTVTIDTSAGNVGTTVSDAPTTAGYSANNRFRPADLIELVVADADSSGDITVDLVLTSTQVLAADETDPGTTVTGDPRGTYEPLLTPDGSEIIVGLVGDPGVNANSRGGLHGIQHYFA